MRIYFDSIQEGTWFQGLHPALAKASLHPFPANPTGPLADVLSLDRPDIVLEDEDRPILVLERTIEVPSGHNVGQRFARLVAAARSGVPAVYFGPYKAYKHGGSTQGPRYMNLRLFYALEQLEAIEKSPVIKVNWPVDENCKIIRDPIKDQRVIEFLDLFLRSYLSKGLEETKKAIFGSTFQYEQALERTAFIQADVRNPEQYDGPPPSVSVGLPSTLPRLASVLPAALDDGREIVFYTIGMKSIRSDPYTGTALLYAYLYGGGLDDRKRHLVLDLPNISLDQWRAAATNPRRKDIRLYRLAGSGILLADSFIVP